MVIGTYTSPLGAETSPTHGWRLGGPLGAGWGTGLPCCSSKHGFPHWLEPFYKSKNFKNKIIGEFYQGVTYRQRY